MVIQYTVEGAVHTIIYKVHEGCIGCRGHMISHMTLVASHMTLVSGHMTLVSGHMILSDVRGSGHMTFTDDVDC